jgi:dihydropteroate synthase
VTIEFAHRSLPTSGPPTILGIVNATPDSFYDQGRTAAHGDAIDHGLALLENGAGALDVGGMTAQPGEELSVGAEIARVVPVIEGLRAQTDTVISVDTYRAEVAEAALAAGADLVNDHTGLSDPAMLATVARARAGLVITHLGLAPKQARDGTYAIDVGAIAEFLISRAATAVSGGVSRHSILIDPGLGFGKDLATDLATLRRLPELLELGFPLLLATSHKEVTAEPLGLPESAFEGTAAVTAIASYLGVAMLRLHDLPYMERVSHMGWLMRPYGAGGASDGSKNDGTNPPSR